MTAAARDLSSPPADHKRRAQCVGQAATAYVDDRQRLRPDKGVFGPCAISPEGGVPEAVARRTGLAAYGAETTAVGVRLVRPPRLPRARATMVVVPARATMVAIPARATMVAVPATMIAVPVTVPVAAVPIAVDVAVEVVVAVIRVPVSVPSRVPKITRTPVIHRRRDGLRLGGTGGHSQARQADAARHQYCRCCTYQFPAHE